ncbi:MAG TPA: thermonuclease family protein [Candidatus Sulfotelmatobacter sp.]|nr:thermonuclease family protein [Candidatus Sulfotelmatobacter sp.]
MRRSGRVLRRRPTGRRPGIGLLLLLSVVLAGVRPAHAASVRLLTATVARVIDGDTLIAFTAHSRLRVRLLGIDAPEIAHDGQPGQRYGPEAKRYLERLVGGRSLRMEAYGRDHYRRVLAVLWVERRNINVEMVRAGWARVYGGAGRRAYAHELKQAEAQARREGVGMWVRHDLRGDLPGAVPAGRLAVKERDRLT